MLATDRQSRLIEIIRRQGFASLPDLAEALDVSESTVRRDLAHLEQNGATKRTHGGAFYTGASPQMAHFRHRQEANWSQKKAIAAVAASVIDDADTVLLDGGSTTYELARLLSGRPLQIVTNSLPVANLFSSTTHVDLILIGGYVHTQSGVIYGDYANEMLESLRVRKAVISAAGVTETGLYNSNHMVAATQQAMVNAAEEVIVVADSTKFGHQSLAHICKLNDIQRFVVDDQLDTEWQKQLKDAGVDLALAIAETAEPTQADTNSTS